MCVFYFIFFLVIHFRCISISLVLDIFLKIGFSPQEFERHFYSEGLTNYSPRPGCLVLQIMYGWKTAIPVYLRIIMAAFTLQRQN